MSTSPDIPEDIHANITSTQAGKLAKLYFRISEIYSAAFMIDNAKHHFGLYEFYLRLCWKRIEEERLAKRPRKRSTKSSTTQGTQS